MPAKLLTPPASLMIAPLPQERQYRYSRTLADLLVFFYKRLDLPPGEGVNRMRLGVRYSRLKENPVGTRPQERKVVTRQRGFDFHDTAAVLWQYGLSVPVLGEGLVGGVRVVVLRKKTTYRYLSDFCCAPR